MKIILGKFEGRITATVEGDTGPVLAPATSRFEAIGMIGSYYHKLLGIEGGSDYEAIGKKLDTHQKQFGIEIITDEN